MSVHTHICLYKGLIENVIFKIIAPEARVQGSKHSKTVHCLQCQGRVSTVDRL